MTHLAVKIRKSRRFIGLSLMLAALAAADARAEDRRLPPAARFSPGVSASNRGAAVGARPPAWQAPQPRPSVPSAWQRPASSPPRNPSPTRSPASVLGASARVLPFSEDEGSPPRESIPQPGVRTETLPLGQPEPVDGEIVFEHGSAGELGEGEEIVSIDGVWDDGVWTPSRSAPLDPMAGEVWNVCSPCSFLNEASIFLGPQSFKTPIDAGLVGNFGFHAGANTGDAIWHRFGIGYQLGGAYSFSNFNGAVAAGGPGVPVGNVRRQVFLTGGLFHRAFYGYGWQGGVVVDYLDDSFFVTTSLSQLRTELAWVFRSGHEFGFHSATRTRQNDQSAVGIPFFFQPLNMYNFFYRRNFPYGGNCRAWAGATGSRGAVFGGDAVLPLTNRIDLIGNFNYVLPSPGGAAGAANEAWAMTMNLVWYPGRAFRGVHNGPYRPLFNVADNASFIMERSP